MRCALCVFLFIMMSVSAFGCAVEAGLCDSTNPCCSGLECVYSSAHGYSRCQIPVDDECGLIFGTATSEVELPNEATQNMFMDFFEGGMRILRETGTSWQGTYPAQDIDRSYGTYLQENSVRYQNCAPLEYGWFQRVVVQNRGEFIQAVSRLFASDSEMFTSLFFALMMPDFCMYNYNGYIDATERIPRCIVCEGELIDKYTCQASCPSGSYKLGTACLKCPDAGSGQTVRSPDGATDISQCYVDSAARFTDSRGTYACGAPDGACKYVGE